MYCCQPALNKGCRSQIRRADQIPPGINTWHICLKYVVNYKTALVIGFNGEVFQADSFCIWLFTGGIEDLFRFNNLKPAILAFTKGDFITIPQIIIGDFLYDNIMQKLDSVFFERIKERSEERRVGKEGEAVWASW